MTDPLDRSFTYRLHLLHKRSDAHTDRRYREQLGLSLGEARCLATVGSFEPMSVMDLAERANLNKGQASRAAQSLVDRGLVGKTDDPDDGRAVTLSLTRRGRSLWTRTMALIGQRNDEIFGCLDARERAQLDRLLDRLLAHNPAP